MNEITIRHELATGEACTACDREIVLVATLGEAEVRVECDCGIVACVGPVETERLLIPAA